MSVRLRFSLKIHFHEPEPQQGAILAQFAHVDAGSEDRGFPLEVKGLLATAVMGGPIGDDKEFAAHDAPGRLRQQREQVALRRRQPATFDEEINPLLQRRRGRLGLARPRQDGGAPDPPFLPARALDFQNFFKFIGGACFRCGSRRPRP